MPVVYLILGITLGAIGAAAIVCHSYKDEMARKAELEILLESSVSMDQIVKILRGQVISHRRRDKEADSWNGALQAVKWDLEDLLGLKHDSGSL